MRWIVFTLLTCTLLPTTAFARLNIGVVDTIKAIYAVEESKAELKQLKKLQKKMKRRWDKAQKRFVKAQKRYKGLRKILKGKALAKALKRLQKKAIKLRQLQRELQRKMQTRQLKWTRRIMGKMRYIINQIARDNGLALILDKRKSGVLYSKTAMDYTSDLIRRYDRRHSNRALSKRYRKKRRYRRNRRKYHKKKRRRRVAKK